MKKYIEREYQLIMPGESSHDTLYAKLKQKELYEGWYTGVNTTRIACLIGCKAGPPKQENVIFSKNLLDLLSHGMRECKVCKPLSYNAPPKLIPFLESVQRAENPNKEWETNPEVNAWMEKQHLTNLSRYLRIKRINYLLKHPNETYNQSVNVHFTWTSLGMMIACFSKKGLCLLEFSDRLMLEAELIKLQKKLKANFKISPTYALGLKLSEELREYFSGQRSLFTIPLDMIGSKFQVSAWKVLQSIPAGEVWTYKQQAIVLGNANSARAVGSANGQNSISIIIPCHRVIGDNKKLVGYGGGLPRKKFLLNLEATYYKNLNTIVKNKKEIRQTSKKRKLSTSEFFGNTQTVEKLPKNESKGEQITKSSSSPY